MNGAIVYKKGDSLPISSQLMPLVIAGHKTTTIRKGIRKVRTNTVLMLRSENREEVPIIVTGVRNLEARDLTRSDALRDGYSTVEELVGELRQIYPDLTAETPLTIISFNLLHPDR